VIKWHHYFDIYTPHFEPYRSKPIKMLEIGVFCGGSMRTSTGSVCTDAWGARLNPNTKAP
jgi:hypothetical protein